MDIEVTTCCDWSRDGKENSESGAIVLRQEVEK